MPKPVAQVQIHHRLTPGTISTTISATAQAAVRTAVTS
jgi:hypothetical protein